MTPRCITTSATKSSAKAAPSKPAECAEKFSRGSSKCRGTASHLAECLGGFYLPHRFVSLLHRRYRPTAWNLRRRMQPLTCGLANAREAGADSLKKSPKRTSPFHCDRSKRQFPEPAFPFGFHSPSIQTQNGLRALRRPFCFCPAAAYFRLPLESMVMPPGPAFFFSSFALRVPRALVVKSFAEATSADTALALP
jgi:hypothetical protein